jgi:hypothetical protein
MSKYMGGGVPGIEVQAWSNADLWPRLQRAYKLVFLKKQSFDAPLNEVQELCEGLLEAAEAMRERVKEQVRDNNSPVSNSEK